MKKLKNGLGFLVGFSASSLLRDREVCNTSPTNRINTLKKLEDHQQWTQVLLCYVMLWHTIWIPYA